MYVRTTSPGALVTKRSNRRGRVAAAPVHSVGWPSKGALENNVIELDDTGLSNLTDILREEVQDVFDNAARVKSVERVAGSSQLRVVFDVDPQQDGDWFMTRFALEWTEQEDFLKEALKRIDEAIQDFVED